MCIIRNISRYLPLIFHPWHWYRMGQRVPLPLVTTKSFRNSIGQRYAAAHLRNILSLKIQDNLGDVTPILQQYHCLGRPDGGKVLVVLISVSQQQLAVENGPCRFVGYTPNGATMSKQRQLCSRGTEPLLSIPY